MRSALPWALVGVMMVALYAMRNVRDVAVDRADAAEDSVAVLAPVVAQLQAEGDSLRGLSLTADTVLVTVTESVVIEIEATQDRYEAVADSLRATLDSAQNVHLVNIEEAHKAEVVAVWRIADERLAWGNTWRDYAMAADSLNRVQAAVIGQYALVNTALRAALRREAVRGRATEVLAMLGVAYVAVDALR